MMFLCLVYGVHLICGWFIVFNTTFDNISVISWCSVLLVVKTIDLSLVTDKLSHNVSSIPCLSKGSNSQC